MIGLNAARSLPLERIGSDMGKRAWRSEVPPVKDLATLHHDNQRCAVALWAIVERLEELVEIGDNLEEVMDLWANSLAFGGQPVGGIDEPVPATRGAWMCDRDSECILMKGHGGEHVHNGSEHVHEPVRYCWCVAPNFNTGGVCGKCGFSKVSKVSDAAQE